jgi:hypothetical protein
VEEARRASRVRMTPAELAELRRLTRRWPVGEELAAFFRRVADRAEAGRPEGTEP